MSLNFSLVLDPRLIGVLDRRKGKAWWGSRGTGMLVVMVRSLNYRDASFTGTLKPRSSEIFWCVWTSIFPMGHLPRECWTEAVESRMDQASKEDHG